MQHGKGKGSSKAMKAAARDVVAVYSGLRLPVQRVHSLLNNGRCGLPAVYLTSTLEYLCAEMMEIWSENDLLEVIK